MLRHPSRFFSLVLNALCTVLRMLTRLRRVAFGGIAIVVMVICRSHRRGACVARAADGLRGRGGTNTQMTMSGTGPGRGVSGFVPDATNPFDPVLDGYPASNPTTGFTPKDEGFAGIIFGQPTDGSPTLSLYCFDLFTDTWPGIGYALGTWDAATVPNVGYVARILNEYYPFVPTQPAGLANTTEQAAAVQAGHLVLQRPLRPQHVRPPPCHGGRDRGPHHLGGTGHGAAGPEPGHHPDQRQRGQHRRHRRPVHGDLRNRVGHGDGDRSRHVFGRSRHRAHRQRGIGDHARPDLAEIDRTDLSGLAGHGQGDRAASRTSTSTTATRPGSTTPSG